MSVFESKVGFVRLELRLYKNDSIQSKKKSNFEIATFFTTYTARGKARQFQNWNIFGLNGVVLMLS